MLEILDLEVESCLVGVLSVKLANHAFEFVLLPLDVDVVSLHVVVLVLAEHPRQFHVHVLELCLQTSLVVQNIFQVASDFLRA